MVPNMANCAYQNCPKAQNSPHDDKYCVFHSPNKKGIADVDFIQLIDKQIQKRDYNFEGYDFPGDISFTARRLDNDVNFKNARFGGKLDFEKCGFLREADFTGAQFNGGRARFYKVAFDGDVIFSDNVISDSLVMNGVSLYERSFFYLRNPLFPSALHKDTRVMFYNVRFIPFATFFENLRFVISSFSHDKLISPIFIFRYCQLRDVYFSNVDMSHFSFYKSTFDEAHFFSTQWKSVKDTVLSIPFQRRNVIGDEMLFSYSKKIGGSLESMVIDQHYEIEYVREFKEIANLYRRLKTALDRTKDYEEAGWFYFNEVEMKRLALKENRQKSNGLLKIKEVGLFGLYYIYKILAGYGGRPLWSFVWFCIFGFFFAFVHTLSGLKLPNGKTFNYDLLLNSHGVKNLFTLDFLIGLAKDGLTALIFSLTRLIPISYLPYLRQEFSPLGIDGLTWAFANSFVLILMVTFIAIGLKRHFKRF